MNKEYNYKGFTFLHHSDGEIEMVSPMDYEVGYFDNNASLEEIQNELLNGIIDLYDFKNRCLKTYPIEKEEIAQIEDRFSKEEIARYFPELNRT